MHPHTHFIGGALLGALGYRLGLIQFHDILIIGIIAVLIDLDHYIYYIYSMKDANPWRFWNRANDPDFIKKALGMRTFIHHYNGMAVIFPLLLLVTLFDIRLGFILLAAYVSHMVLDHLRYFHIRVAPYRRTEVLGLKILWNGSEELLFLIMTFISVVMIF